MIQFRSLRVAWLFCLTGHGARPLRLAWFVLAALSGCSGVPDDYEVNRVFARNQKLARSLDEFAQPHVAQRLADIQRAVTHYFGTPAQPTMPAGAGMDLAAASGEQLTAAAVLYRDLCARCHGIAGSGTGPAARRLNPYPRDYRRGLFKFKSTPATLPPTDEDLQGVLVRGVPETAMPSFQWLDEMQREALAEYVRYLTLRGLFERAVITEVATAMDEDERLLEPEYKESRPTAYARQLELLDELLAGLVEPWLEVNQARTVVTAPPADYGTPESIARGREWFFTTLTNCGKCHGDTGVGDGQTEDYDEWAKELEPTSPEALADYLALGALPPRFAQPRDLRIGNYRGGNRPEDQYVKLKNGIAGTTMTSVAAQLSDEDVWHLVAYARSLPAEFKEETASQTGLHPDEPVGVNTGSVTVPAALYP